MGFAEKVSGGFKKRLFHLCDQWLDGVKMFRPIPQLTHLDNLVRHRLASQSRMNEFSGLCAPSVIQSDLSDHLMG